MKHVCLFQSSGNKNTIYQFVFPHCVCRFKSLFSHYKSPLQFHFHSPDFYSAGFYWGGLFINHSVRFIDFFFQKLNPLRGSLSLMLTTWNKSEPSLIQSSDLCNGNVCILVYYRTAGSQSESYQMQRHNICDFVMVKSILYDIWKLLHNSQEIELGQSKILRLFWDISSALLPPLKSISSVHILYMLRSTFVHQRFHKNTLNALK